MGKMKIDKSKLILSADAQAMLHRIQGNVYDRCMELVAERLVDADRTTASGDDIQLCFAAAFKECLPQNGTK